MVIAICDVDIEIRQNILSSLDMFFDDKGVQVETLEIQSANELVSSNEKIDLVFMSSKRECDRMNTETICEVLHKQEKDCLVVLIVEDMESPYIFLSKNVCVLLSKNFNREQLNNCLESIYDKIIFKDDLVELGKDNWERKSNIRYIKASDKYCEVYANDYHYLVRSSMSAIKRKLCDEGFIRTHRSYIVNLTYVADIDKTIRMNDDTRIKYSRGKKEELLIKYDQYISSR